MVKESKFKKSKLVLNQSERRVLQTKILPFSLLEGGFWMLGQISFGFLFRYIFTLNQIYTVYLYLIIVGIILFILSYLLATHRRNSEGSLLFLTFSFISGSYTAPIFIIVEKLNLYLYFILSFGLGAIIITFLIGELTGEKLFSEHSFLYHLILFVSVILSFEGIMIIALGITSIPSILASLILLTFTCLTFFLCCGYLSKKIKEEYWLVLGIQILVFTFILILYILILIIIIICIATVLCAGECDCTDLDLPDISDLFNGRGEKKIYEKTL